MLNLKLKQARCAFGDGRLDEAFELIKADSVLQHRQGQKLALKLSKAFSERGSGHLEAGRIEQGLSDCNKAEKLGGNLPEIALLRSAICQAMENKRLADQQNQAKLADAKENIQNGWLSVGEEILSDASEQGQAQVLLQNAKAVRAKVDAVVCRTQQALKRNDLEGAIDIIKKGSVSLGMNDKADNILIQVRSKLHEYISGNLNKGRIDLAFEMLSRSGSIAIDSVETKELTQAVSWCNQAAQYIRSGQFSRASELLQRLKIFLPKAPWLDKAIAQAQKGATAIESLRTGPLGLIHCDSGDNTAQEDENPDIVSNTGAVKRGKFSMAIPSTFILQIDGVGSYLVLCDNRVTVGPVSSSARPMVGLVAAPNLPVAVIERTEGDYFIRSDRSIVVNDASVTEKLLTDGDRIALSNRCRMRFNLPNAASTTAMINLASARLPRVDINKVILMDREILIGRGPANHIVAEQTDEKIVLLVNNGKLVCRTKASMEVDGRRVDPRCGLVMNTPVRIGQLSMVLTPLKEEY